MSTPTSPQIVIDPTPNSSGHNSQLKQTLTVSHNVTEINLPLYEQRPSAQNPSETQQQVVSKGEYKLSQQSSLHTEQVMNNVIIHDGT